MVKSCYNINTIIIATSNAGSELLRKREIRFDPNVSSKIENRREFEKRIMGILKDSFKPEFKQLSDIRSTIKISH